MKVCSACKENKALSEYHKRSDRVSGVASQCKSCRSAIEKSRYAKNAKRIISQKREYNETNREKINARQRRYNEENKEKRARYWRENKDKINAYTRERRRKNPIVALQERLRRRTRYAFKQNGYRKGSPTEKILGAPWEVVMAHIESQFKEGMSWDNRGEWEIDHIIPYKEAKTEEDVIRLSHYTNLQPLWRRDNRRKGGLFIGATLHASPRH